MNALPCPAARLARVLLVVSVACLASACDPKGPASSSGSCGGEDGSACDGGFCFEEQCLDAAGDDDQDGLVNQRELELGSDPLDADSDGDGEEDLPEVGSPTGEPLDRDGDGVPDVLESSVEDADGDCVVDEYDPAPTTPGALLDAHCPKRGVCLAAGALPAIACVGEAEPSVGSLGAPSCDLSAVEAFEAGDEATCDGLDNDCDGETDEPGAGGLCGDDEPCTVDVCRGELGCENRLEADLPLVTTWVGEGVGEPRDVALIGGWIAVAAGPGGLQLLDPASGSPVPTAGLALGAPTRALVTLDETTLAVAAGDAGLALVTVGLGGQPALSTLVDLGSGSASDVAVQDEWVAVAAGVAGLALLALDAPSEGPVWLDVGGYAWAVAAADKARWVVGRDGDGAVLVDASDPLAPTVERIFDLEGETATTVASDGVTAWLGDLGGGLWSAELDGATPPARTPLPGLALALSLEGDVLAVALQGAVMMFSVADPGAPSLLRTVAAAGARGVYLSSDATLFVAAGEALDVWLRGEDDWAGGVAAQPASSTAFGSILDVATDGERAYLAEGAAGLRIVHAPPSGELVTLGRLEEVGGVASVAVGQDVVWIATASGSVVAVDVTPPSSPQARGEVLLDGPASSLSLRGSVALAAAGAGGLAVLDLSDVDAPVVVGALAAQDAVVGVAWLDGDLGVAALGAGGAWVVDLSDPAAPAWVAEVEAAGPSVGVAGRGAWGLTAGDGLSAVDGPSHAITATAPWNAPLLTPAWLAVADGLAFVGYASGGVGVFDAREPAGLAAGALGLLAVQGPRNAASWDGHGVVLATGSGGLELRDRVCP